MRWFILIFLQLALFSDNLQLCYVEEKYKSIDKLFGHLFLAYGEKAASFNLASDANLKDNLKAFFGTDALMQILQKKKLIKFYNSLNRSVKCYRANISEVENANISALFYENEISDRYVFLKKNCASALAIYAKKYETNLKSSILPKRFIALNTDEKYNFSNFGIFYAFKENKFDFTLTLLELNHLFSHYLSFFSFSKDYFSLIKIAELDAFSYELEIAYKQKRVFADFFLGYRYKNFFIGANNYGLSGGFIYEHNDFALKLKAYKKALKLEFYKDFKNFRFSLIANKNYAKIGLIYTF